MFVCLYALKSSWSFLVEFLNVKICFLQFTYLTRPKNISSQKAYDYSEEAEKNECKVN